MKKPEIGITWDQNFEGMIEMIRFDDNRMLCNGYIDYLGDQTD